MAPKIDPSVLVKMRSDWDELARENARHYVATGQEQWSDRDFFRTGEINVANDVMPEMFRICGGSRSPRDLSMLEIGCGVGRMTRMLCRIFGHVTAVDVSKEMIEGARVNLRAGASRWRRFAGIWRFLPASDACKNVTLLLGDGATLSGVPDASRDFAFSFIVFQHIPSIDVIRSYCREVFRVLRPGALFKFQVCGGAQETDDPVAGTWAGVRLSEEKAAELACSTGFELEASQGADSQYFWLWFRKPWG
ncbi:MAG TPA: class I SAM-dependent methyltransferase [Bryobacteraceae bacterium]|nr:class I SAM-dependent methyltransferase [Bryobacteraceae bacterium]